MVFDQIYGDNSGGPELDTDLDGTATQEDEFVSVVNTTGAPIDISGWQIWSDSSGSNAPDPPQDGLYHTFPPGTVLAPGETLWIINEISGSGLNFAQEASEGGVESGNGGQSTNLLSEGNGGGAAESVALVDPASGDFIVFNMSPNASVFSNFDNGGSGGGNAFSAFPGSSMIAEEDGNSVQADMGAGFSYQYNAATDSYTYFDAFIPCFLEGTRIETDCGAKPVEDLEAGDLVRTADAGYQPVKAVMSRDVVFGPPALEKERPVLFQPGSLGANMPTAPLAVSPQHRVVVHDAAGSEWLCPAKGLLGRPGVRRMNGRRQVRYVHLILAAHQVVFAEGAPAESFYPGAYARDRLPPRIRQVLDQIGPADGFCEPVRPFIGASAVQRTPWRVA
ncbi:MAG: Hint domain-containing protein [Pseudomonadota bacterium]